jgi:hypothetical protein
MADYDPTQVPTLKEIDAMVETSGSRSGECTLLCHDLLDALDRLGSAPPPTGVLRLRLLARVKALRAQMKTLHCPLCLPE